jgi:hypothetical protein
MAGGDGGTAGGRTGVKARRDSAAGAFKLPGDFISFADIFNK